MFSKLTEAYSTLRLSPSTYDYAFLVGVVCRRLLCRAYVLMAGTCLVQFAVLYLLSWQIERNELTQPCPPDAA